MKTGFIRCIPMNGIFIIREKPVLSGCDTILFLAYKDGKLMGRIMGIINHKYNTIHNENNGQIFCTWML